MIKLISFFITIFSLSSYAVTMDQVCNELKTYPTVCEEVSYCDYVKPKGYCDYDGNPAGRYLSQSGVTRGDAEMCERYANLGFTWIKRGSPKCVPALISDY